VDHAQDDVRSSSKAGWEERLCTLVVKRDGANHEHGTHEQQHNRKRAQQGKGVAVAVAQRGGDGFTLLVLLALVVAIFLHRDRLKHWPTRRP